MENQNRIAELLAIAAELKAEREDDLAIALHTYRRILMRQNQRSHAECYHINKAIQIFNRESGNGEDWRVPTTPLSMRRPLTEAERDHLLDLAATLRTLDVSPRLKYYINCL